jgi:imidazolonepropionase
LETGKVANFVLYDCDDYREIAYYFGASLVHSVYVRGEAVRCA